MKAKTSILLLLLLMIVCKAVGIEEQIPLIRDGGTNYRIMVSPGASPVEAFAAQELQGYVMQISSVFLPMAKGNIRPEERLILVGKGAVDILGLEIDESRLMQDGFVIKTAGNKIILAGGNPRGTLYSVYAFLEMLGCRWLSPGILGEIIPRRNNITIPAINRLERPGLAYRGFTNLIPLAQEGVQWIDWMAKNKMNYFMVSQSRYADFKAVLGGELERRGMDVGVSFDSSILPDQALEFIASNPEVDITAFYVKSSDNIIKIVAEQYSDKLVFLTQPDQMASGRCYRHSLGDKQCEINCEVRKHLENQLGSGRRMHVHEHYMGPYSQNSLPFPILHTIASDLEYFDSLSKLDGVISQGEPGNWGAYGLSYYVFARMAWNADDDLEGIVDDYCEKYYGAAGDSMKKYFAILEDAMSATEHFRYVDPPTLILDLLNENLLSELETQIQNAKELAGDAMIFDRLKKTELSLIHARLLWHTLNHYFHALQFQKTRDNGKAVERFQQSISLGERLVAFLFQNIDEGVYVIPETYIFDYLEPLIIDARERKDLLGTE